ncbi:SPOR domain-containing protein [Flavobacterium sp. N2270]|uniref:SPOR domain-containing protein n=1 Tax=Flavobacterium sp. N2270 TaxID=2986831 RepID=UPI0022255B33|nr:SPOR domain-containing protein [Flavobacterium sp. N2270]
MRNLAHKPILLISFIFLLLCTKSFSQDLKTSVEQDVKFQTLLKEKQKINNNLSIIDNYKIQIFYGSGEESKKKLSEFKRDFKDIEGTIIYSNPTYKVFVGNYKSRLHAEKFLIEIKKKYPSALLIKPGK